MTEAVPGPLLIGLEGLSLTARERDWLAHPAVGGVVLFTRNYSGIEQLEDLNAAIRDAAAAPMLICVDHEGGRVQRFHDGFTRLPPLALLGRMYADAPGTAADFAYRHARVMATELLVAGVDFSFAPVLDLDIESCVIGNRSFGADPDVVTALAGHYLAGLHDSGMKACGKHFPGHGSVLADSHVDAVVDPRPLAAIEAADMRPFEALLPQLDSLMMAHVIYPDVDERPAGYSSRWVREILRERLGYQGVVFSDDLGMHAAGFAGDLSARLAMTLGAGCDAALVCHPDEVAEVMPNLVDVEPCPALARLAGRSSMTRAELQSVGEWRHWQQSLQQLEDSQWA